MLEIQYQPTVEDLNQANHIDNVRIYDWFNQQRLNYFSSLGVSDEQIRPFLASTQLDFKGELFHSQPVTITTAIKKLGNKSITTEQHIYQEQQLCASCIAVSVCFDMSRKQTVAIPEALRKVLMAEVTAG